MSALWFAAVREALNLGLQAWRTTEARQKFIEASDALALIEAELDGREIAEAAEGKEATL